MDAIGDVVYLEGVSGIDGVELSSVSRLVEKVRTH